MLYIDTVTVEIRGKSCDIKNKISLQELNNDKKNRNKQDSKDSKNKKDINNNKDSNKDINRNKEDISQIQKALNDALDENDEVIKYFFNILI